MRLSLQRYEEPVAFYRFGDGGKQSRITFLDQNGGRETLPLFQLKKITWNPDLAAIILTFIDERVTIYGRNLTQLCAYLEDDDVGVIQEKHVNEIALKEGECFIERTDWEQL